MMSLNEVFSLLDINFPRRKSNDVHLEGIDHMSITIFKREHEKIYQKFRLLIEFTHTECKFAAKISRNSISRVVPSSTFISIVVIVIL